MLPEENNFNKNGLPHVYIASFRCLWVPGGGLEPFRSFTFWQLASPKEKHKAGDPLAKRSALEAP